ncbi:MAG: carbon-nitrogen hydrolase family protein [Polyangiaceae bacterium]|nr:carbon-nitrogen hydrolase family protein [Polyangiaceae bacterium]
MKLVLVQPVLRHAPGETNVTALRALLAPLAGTLSAGDCVLLPERFHLGGDPAEYLRDVAALARELGCHVVGGSRFEPRGDTIVNSGVVVDASGAVTGRYEKLRPYAIERAVVTPGTSLGEVTIAGHPALVLICADFWFADLLTRAAALPDLVLVPALSVSRKATPDYSCSLWRHLAVSRAYELGCFIGVSDFDPASELPALRASGVAGFADPTALDPDAFFRAVPGSGVLVVDLDFAALEALRRDRRERGFYWRDPG